ncbi:DNA polymerase IV [Nocardioides sp. TRM66260-LWL]|uniref:DNA polymerase IV n=1 Tax=Nocardioides sp. TRM66260-LWL TaxID=2874478 RepID=UPI001CC4EA35|nr:DNA polymerase IV [Nocardioides sp. TRM66260-LWL]MBZ5734706.1 DNA polymerase IV [Nocardioides sp. TRM66260-LWL]
MTRFLHADLDSFYASVEQRDAPELRGRPVVVGAGVVLAASYEARAFGVRGGMGGHEARRRCPQAVTVPPRFSAYVEASRAVFEVFADTTPLVEGVSIDEAFLDVGGLARLVGPAEVVARRLRERVRDEVGLPISVGVARTKHLAKVASAAAKPDGLLVVPAEREEAFLHPLPVERLWGVGPVTARRLHEQGVHTVGQLAAREESELASSLGRAAAQHVWALANLRDPRPVVVGRRRSSVGAQCALPRGAPTGRDDLEAVLVGLVERVARRLRAGERIARTLTLRLRFGDFGTATRSATLPRSTAITATWIDTARDLLRAAWPMVVERGCTLLGVSVSGLDDGSAEQLELDLFGHDEQQRLDATLDAVRDRFGSAAVGRAALVGRRIGFEAPQLPDGP